jgi:hypothetical protein
MELELEDAAPIFCRLRGGDDGDELPSFGSFSIFLESCFAGWRGFKL